MHQFGPSLHLFEVGTSYGQNINEKNALSRVQILHQGQCQTTYTRLQRKKFKYLVNNLDQPPNLMGSSLACDHGPSLGVNRFSYCTVLLTDKQTNKQTTDMAENLTSSVMGIKPF